MEITMRPLRRMILELQEELIYTKDALKRHEENYHQVSDALTWAIDQPWFDKESFYAYNEIALGVRQKGDNGSETDQLSV